MTKPLNVLSDIYGRLEHIATQAEAEAGTDNTAYMTPLRTAQTIAVLGLQDSGSSLSQNGYMQLSNGLIIQWGMYGGGIFQPTVTFPVAYPTAVYIVVAIPSGGAANYMASLISKSQTEFVCSIDRYDALDSTMAFDWFSVGY